jgi:segregation and condensation protein B
VIAEKVKSAEIEQLINEIAAEYTERNSPIELTNVAGGWQFSSRKEYSFWVRKLFKEKTTFKLSNSALETLSVIAYKQPITLPEIQALRGVDAAGVVHTLLKHKLVATAGRKKIVGKPMLYKTTRQFLVQFGLDNLAELPNLKELEELSRAAIGEDAEEQRLPSLLEAAESQSTDPGEPEFVNEPDAAEDEEE